MSEEVTNLETSETVSSVVQELVPDSTILSADFRSDNDDEMTAARVVREFYAHAHEKYNLQDRKVLPGVLTQTVMEGIVKLRKTLEAKEDGELVFSDWAKIPTLLHATDPMASDLVQSARGIFIDLATMIAEEVGCKYTVVPSDSVNYEVISFH